MLELAFARSDPSTPAGVAAVAATREFGLALQAGQLNRARAVLADLEARWSGYADDRGLPRALAARALLVPHGSVREGLDWLRSLVQEPVSGDDYARLALEDTVAEELRRRAGAADLRELEEIRRSKDSAAPERRLRAAFHSTFQPWILAGAPGRATAVDGGPGEDFFDRLFLRVSETGVQAGEARWLTGAELWTEAGGGSEGARIGGVVIVVGRMATPTALALRGPLSGFVLSPSEASRTAFLAEDRQSRLLLAALAGLGVLAVLAASLALARAQRGERAQIRAREDFVAAVTHELKAPLASIRLFAELMERDRMEPARVQEFAGQARLEAERLTRLVESVLELARIERSPDIPVRKTSCRLQELVSQTTGLAEPLLTSRGFGLRVAPVPSTLALATDPTLVVGILLNLVENAVKHAGEPHPLDLVTRATPAGIELGVLDRGPGIPKEDRERIFEPFVRLGSELRRERPGVGLGLALAARMAGALGGDLRVEAREGGGSEFWLRLPLEGGNP